MLQKYQNDPKRFQVLRNINRDQMILVPVGAAENIRNAVRFVIK